MKITALIYVVLFSFSSIFGGKTIKQANKAYKEEAYRQALELYLQHVDEQGNENVNSETNIKIANCYLFLNNFAKAKDQFEIAGEANLKGSDKLNYAKLLFYQGDIEGAKKLFESEPENIIAQSYLSNISWLNDKSNDTSLYKIEKTDINTLGQSFGVQYYQGGIVFSSSSNDINLVSSSANQNKEKKELDLKGLEFLNLYYAPVINNGEIGSPVLFSEDLKFDYHIGAVTFGSDFKTMFYTKVIKLDDNETVLKIYTSEYKGGTWQAEKPLNFNSDAFNCAHPALSITSDTLYFVSDMPKGKGGKDIYFCRRIGSTWSVPENFSKVNTNQDEFFPFVSLENKFYFASNGFPGYGGLDIFVLDMSKADAQVENLKNGINTRFDDFAYVINPNNKDEGFISSNRATGGRFDNVFRIYREDPILVVEDTVVPDTTIEPVVIPMIEMTNNVFNSLSGQAIPNALIKITDKIDNSLIFEGVTDELGKCNFKMEESLINPLSNIHISVIISDKFESYERTKTGEDFINLHSAFTDINVVPIIEKTQTITIPQNKLNFALNSFTLSYEAKKILERWYEYLDSKPNVRLRLNAHTDSQGDLEYNLRLSQKRADNAKNYLVQRGIDAERIISRGYGERYILNHCKDGVSCTNEEHEVNRRLEIIVIVD